MTISQHLKCLDPNRDSPHSSLLRCSRLEPCSQYTQVGQVNHTELAKGESSGSAAASTTRAGTIDMFVQHPYAQFVNLSSLSEKSSCIISF